MNNGAEELELFRLVAFLDRQISVTEIGKHGIICPFGKRTQFRTSISTSYIRWLSVIRPSAKVGRKDLYAQKYFAAFIPVFHRPKREPLRASFSAGWHIFSCLRQERAGIGPATAKISRARSLRMSLAKRNERAYLEIHDWASGFSIVVKREHANELSALLTQLGMAHKWGGTGQDALFFNAGSDKLRVAEILESYKNARGS
jgi:hypothetical protein